jgi:hypothetical protein
MQLLDLCALRPPPLVCRAGAGDAADQKQLLSTYVWRVATSGQHFCPTCGVAVIRTSTQFAPPVSINARCLEGVDIGALTIRPFDGKHLIP